MPPRPRAYESPDLRGALVTPICVLLRGFYAFLPIYGSKLSCDNPMLMIVSRQIKHSRPTDYASIVSMSTEWYSDHCFHYIAIAILSINDILNLQIFR